MPSYAIVYDSRTGNTERLAHAVAAALPAEECVLFCSADEVDILSLLLASRVYAGFWTNRGDCSDALALILEHLNAKEVFLFGTAGFGADQTYFAGVMARVARHVNPNSRIVGSFMCQGQMPPSVRERYVRTMEEHPAQAARMRQLIENFDAAVGHPDEADLAALQEAVRSA